MPMTYKRGFSFIEIVVAIMIMGIMAAFVIPKLRFRGARAVDSFTNDLVKLTTVATERAIMTGTVHRVFFAMNHEGAPRIEVQAMKKKSDKEQKQDSFEPLASEYSTTAFTLNPQLTIKNFYIKGIDEAAQGSLKDAWFYLLPDGVAQDIIINVLDEVTGDRVGLVLNPFSAKFAIYDTFQKPYTRI